MRGKIITEKHYQDAMNNEVASFVKEHIRHARFLSSDGTKIHALYALHDKPKAAVLLVHGLSEFAERYIEQIYYFYNEGYSVFAPDLRGHGRSGRKIPEANRIFVRSFNEYIMDLQCAMEQLLKEKCPNDPVLIYGHSMGGCISALFLEEFPESALCAVLSSPMIGINFGGSSEKSVRMLAAASKVLSWNNKTLGKDHFDSEPSFEESCSLSKVRFDQTLKMRLRHRAYQTENITYSWARAALAATDEVMKNAEKIKIPILICQAGNDTFVNNDAQNRFAALIRSAEIIRFPTAKHEIANSEDDILELYWSTVFDFFENQLKKIKN